MKTALGMIIIGPRFEPAQTVFLAVLVRHDNHRHRLEPRILLDVPHEINTVHPASMSAAGSLLYADFAAYGFYSWNGTAWTKINTYHPASMSASGSVLYADFAGLGIYKWELGAWSQLTPTDPAIMLAGF